MIKKGNLNYDQSGRAYPDKPQIQENWDCIWEYDGKHYKLVGDDEHKEWEEVNLYNQIIDEVYDKYRSQQTDFFVPIYWKDKFIEKCKTNEKFSKKWGLKIEVEELSLDERNELLNKALNRNHKRKDCFSDKEFEIETLKDANAFNIPTKLITVTYNNETIEVYG